MRILTSLTCAVLIMGLVACGGGSDTKEWGTGSGIDSRFRVYTTYTVNNQQVADPKVVVSGVSDALPYYNGPLHTSFPSTYTGSNGELLLHYVYLPSWWTITRFPSSHCNQVLSKTGYMIQDRKFGYSCDSRPPFAADPLVVNSGAPPSTISLSSGESLINSTNGMPLMDIYNLDGSVVASAQAETVAADGMSATFPTPPALLSQPTGTYIVTVSNVQPDQTEVVLGGAVMDVVGYTPPPPPPDDDPCNFDPDKPQPECPAAQLKRPLDSFPVVAAARPQPIKK